jgi:hypothetical protein
MFSTGVHNSQCTVSLSTTLRKLSETKNLKMVDKRQHKMLPFQQEIHLEKTAEFAAKCTSSIGSTFVSHKTWTGAMTVICAGI